MLRIYYSNEEYEPNKHKILTTYSDRTTGEMPEETSNVLSNYSIIEVEERYNPNWYKLYRVVGGRMILDLPDEFYINNSGQIVNADTSQVVNINPNPQKESYKLSQLYGLTHAQLDTYIDNQLASITDLASAKAIIGELIRKLAHIDLWLAKQNKWDE